MKFALYGRIYAPDFHNSIINLIDILIEKNAEISIYKPLMSLIEEYGFEKDLEIDIFESPDDIKSDTNYLISIGGDGTFLETIPYVKEYNIPVIGINSGRLGFLADIAREKIPSAIESIFNNRYEVEERTLIELETNGSLFKEHNYALNEFTIQKQDSGSMITIHTYINNEYLNSYWADGIIVSTPTGSTAYSLSVGGPIVLPNSENFILTPLAPHNLTVRPIVLADKNEITFKVEGRSKTFLASLDYQSESFESSLSITVKKANFKLKILKLENLSFFSTLRNKLMWGLDKRN